MEIDALFNDIKKMGSFANKELGQNYLINKDISKKIVDLLDLNTNDNVLEIGSGFGSLSIFLLNLNFKSLTFNDIDPRSIDFLNSLLDQNINKIEVINKSALKLDLNKYNKIISNIPYYITNDLLERCFTLSNADKYVFMVQKEVYERLNSHINLEEYGPLSILISNIGCLNKEFIVSKDNFSPMPHVDSIVFSVTKNKELDINKYDFLMFLKRMFLHRRKTIYNNLSLYLSNKETAKEVLTNLNIQLLSRPEEIDPYTYLNIFKKVLCYLRQMQK